MNNHQPDLSIAIACGGTGGHLFPGIAVAEKLLQRNCAVTLMISPKEVDQQAVKNISGMNLVTLPAVGLQRGAELAFLRGFGQSWRASRKSFKSSPPNAVIAMGGFTSAPPVLAAKTCGARTFLHESNTIPGRANRWLSRVVNRAFVGFPSAASRLKNSHVTVTGTPVRPCFRPRDPRACRLQLGLDPARPMVLVVGGSQGATGINQMVREALPAISAIAPHLQWFHLAGPNDAEDLKATYGSLNLSAVVHPFFDEMDLALGAASAAVSRAGASSLAELAAMRVPSVLVPYPVATDDHQRHNALAFVETGAARLLEQKHGSPEILARTLLELIENPAVREQMQKALALWQTPNAADEIAQTVLGELDAMDRPALRSRKAVSSNGFKWSLVPRESGAGALSPCLEERVGEGRPLDSMVLESVSSTANSK
jgi:UDP-N-acetylglucosamine--N-acetylmuramyl-(pentapeptide) pyrophosphoryl-undecaprenol N-acetylglucosamine transferase